MQTFMRKPLQLIALLLLVFGLIGIGFTPVQAAGLPPSACTATAPITCDLWAETGSFTPPGGSATNIRGYSATNIANGTLSLPGGPVLVVTQGDVVTVTLHNDLPESTSLLFQGQAMIPDTTGAAAGGTKTYTFTAANPGTFLYEAGFEAVEASVKVGRQHQVAMGMYGALVVRASAGPSQAYANANSAFNEEALLVLGEVDPVLNNTANPTSFDMRKYNPQYFLINGKAYSNADPASIAVAAGNKVLLRYVNAGLQAHSMSTLGLSQQIVGQDGSSYAFARPMVAETIATGQTLDAIVTIPASAATGTNYVLYDANMLLHNSNTGPYGGMLTLLSVGAGSPPPPVDTTGPAVSLLGLTPNPTNGASNVTVSATLSDAATGNANVTLAEFYIDSTAGTPNAMAAVVAPFDAPTEAVTGTISTAVMAALPAGNHNVYVRGQDALGNWGPFLSIALNLDKAGPTTSALALSPNPSDGTVAVMLTATADDTASGNSNVTAAEYTVDGGAATAFTITTPAPSVSLSANIPSGLSQGSHVVSVRSQDAFGNWGAPATINLMVGDTVAPITSGVSASPNPNNGALPLNTSVLAVRVSASFSDATTGGANIAAAEGFIDTVGTTGTGFAFVPTDGLWNNPTETGYADVPLAVINALSNGNHTIYVHAKDAPGNWGATSTVTLLIDRTAPTSTGMTVSPNPTLGAASVTLTITGASDPLVGGLASGVSGGEYWFGTTNPAPGAGTPFSGLTPSVPVNTLAAGTYTLRARVRDAAGNWSTTIHSVSLTVVPDAIFSDGFESPTTLPGNWTSRSINNTTRLNNTTTAALVGARGMQAQGNNTNYVQYNFGTTANPASGTFDARFYFNPNGNTGSNQDIFVARTTAGTTVFRVRYRWNGGSPQVQIQVGTGTGNAAWTGITNGISNRIEVVWQAVGSGGPTPGTLVLYVNGAVAASQSLTTTSTNMVGNFRLGSVTSGGNATLEYFDAFSAKRTVTPYGP